MLQYTNRGLGFVHLRARVLCRPEITVFTLRSPGKLSTV
jgi:predicted MPP superfamily phosphohydrolase